MILTILHRTTYRYAHPVALQAHRMMLCPRGQHDLRLIDAQVECTPPAQIEWTQDVFGNLIATASFDGPSDALTIESRMVVEQTAAAWPVFKIALSAHSYPFTYSVDEAADLGALRHPQFAGEAEDVRSWAATFQGPEPTDTLTLLKAINASIAPQYAYVAREEEGTQSPAETIRLGSGSCRDFASLFIEAVRSLGFGARAVSGYIQDDPEASAEQHGTTHAWAEVYLPCAGWITFDPTHSRVGGAGLIPIAVARNIDQIAPIQGSFTGNPGDFLGMAVSVSVLPATPDGS